MDVCTLAGRGKGPWVRVTTGSGAPGEDSQYMRLDGYCMPLYPEGSLEKMLDPCNPRQ